MYLIPALPQSIGHGDPQSSVGVKLVKVWLLFLRLFVVNRCKFPLAPPPPPGQAVLFKAEEEDGGGGTEGSRETD